MNILVLMCDQLPQSLLGCYGSSVARTPNIDRLAAEGLRCTRNYVANPICMPSRASFWSGQTPRSHGIWTNGVDGGGDIPLLSHHLAAQGWQTSAFGKVHLRPHETSGHFESNEDWKQGRLNPRRDSGPYFGFEHVELVQTHIPHCDPIAHYGIWAVENGFTDSMRGITWHHPHCGVAHVPAVLHDSTFVGERVSDWIAQERDKNRPFCCWASFQDPHHPWLEPEDQVGAFADGDMELLPNDPDGLDTRPPHYRAHAEGRWSRAGVKPVSKSKPVPAEALARHRLAVLHNQMTLVDAAVGRILRTLDAEGLTEDTLVIFTADHGELLGLHGLWLKGPFFYDQLIKTPLIFRLPGRVAEGAVTDALISDLDIAATLASLCGVPPLPRSQGMDQSRVLADPTLHVRTRCLVEYRSGYAYDFAGYCLIEGSDKYAFFSDGSEEYCNLEEDPDERRSTHQEHPGRCGALRKNLLKELIATESKQPPQLSGA